MKKKNEGITLVALVITIIVLLILAGVALSLVAGNEGILSKAETAVTETNIASAKEQAELMAAELSVDYYEKRYVDRDTTVSNQEINEYIAGQIGATGKLSSNGDYSVKVDGANLTVSDAKGVVVVSGTLEESGKVSWNESTEEEQRDAAGLYKDDGSFIPWATLIEDGTLTVTEGEVKCNDTSIAGRLVFDTNVTRIGINGFRNCKSLSSIDIPGSVTSIGDSAFGTCKILSSVTLGEGVTTIEPSAFRECYKLSSINIPKSMTNIGEYAFYYAVVKNVTIDSETIASGLIEYDSCGHLMVFTTTVYVKSGLTVGSCITENYTQETTSDKEGYVMYTK